MMEGINQQPGLHSLRPNTWGQGLQWRLADGSLDEMAVRFQDWPPAY